MEERILSCINLARFWARKYSRSADEREECLSIAFAALVRSSKTYDSIRFSAKFSTYASVAIKWALGRWREEISKLSHSVVVSDDGWSQLQIIPDYRQAENAVDIMGELAPYLKLLKPRYLAVIKSQFVEAETLSQTGKRLNIGKERVKQIKQRAILELRKAMKNCELSDFTPEHQQTLARRNMRPFSEDEDSPGFENVVKEYEGIE